MVATASKQAAQEDNQTDLEQFIAQCCEQTPDKHALFASSTTAFSNGCDASEKHAWSKSRVANELPVRHQPISGTDQRKVTFPT